MDLIWEQEAAGSNPAIPTSLEHMSILVRCVPCVADIKRRHTARIRSTLNMHLAAVRPGR
jgi:hypothetical protein